MTVTRRALSGLSHLRSAAAAAAASTLLIGVTAAGCTVGPYRSTAAPSSSASTAPVSPAGQRIVLRFDHDVVPATLADTIAAREFASLLPLTLDLRDPMGQAKSGRLPSPIEHTNAEKVTDPDLGGIYYAPDSETLAIFYDDLGQSVPPPGLVRLGTVEGGVDTIAAAGNRMRILIDLADRTSS